MTTLAAPLTPALQSADGKAVVYLGDCLDVLRRIPDNSVHAVITDPPYGLSQIPAARVTDTVVRWATGDREFIPDARGFKSAAWDAFVPPPAVFDECFRILKPGGHLLAFAGTRTVDLMGLSIRLAGFDVRDSVAWAYGCHDDKTEVLTDTGWKRGIDLTDSDRVMQWDSGSGALSLTEHGGLLLYPFSGDMVKFRNADTDQLVTPNHRVYSQSSDRTMISGVRTAVWSHWKVDEAATINRWQARRFPTSGLHDGPGIGGVAYAALLGWVWSEGGFDRKWTGVRITQSSVNPSEVAEIDKLVTDYGAHKHYQRVRTYKGREYTEHTWFISGELAKRLRKDLPGKHPTYELLWNMTTAEKRALWAAALRGDGHEGAHQTTFYQKGRPDLEWAQTLLACIGQRGKVKMRPAPRDGGQVDVVSRDTVQTVLRHLVDAREFYEGDVWCVTVPTGAFMVRRNGKVFISGNSGFPKGQDIGARIDKAAGATREVVGRRVHPTLTNQPRVRSTAFHADTLNSDQEMESWDLTAPATAEAARWTGWSNALKPAFEPILMAQKPFTGPLYKNVLAEGVGGLNTAATRISGEPVPINRLETWSGFGEQVRPAYEQTMNDAGRYPSNLFLDEEQAAALNDQTNALTSRFFYVAKANKNERPVASDGTRHPTTKPLALMRQLARLVTPAGGTIIDPFAGSGTTVEAAILEGFNVIGVEREPVFVELIGVRMDRTAATRA